MSGRRAHGSALIRGLVMVAVAGLVGFGCGEKPDAKLADAKTALEAGDLAGAEELAKAAEALEPGCAADLLAAIETAKAEKAKQEALEAAKAASKAAATEAQDLLAADKLDEAEAKAKGALEKDAANQMAKDVLAKVAEKRAEARAAAERAAAEKDAAERAAAEKDAAERAAREKAERQRAERERKERETAERRRQEELARAKRRRYDDAMRSGQRHEDAGRLDQARRSYDQARRDAPDSRARRRAEQAIARVRRAGDYGRAMEEGDKALARGDHAAAIAHYTRAKNMRITPEVNKKLDEARAVKLEADGDGALTAANYAAAIAKFEEAQALRPTPGLADKLDTARAAKTRADYLAKVEDFKAARKAQRFSAIMGELEALAKQYPQWKEARAVLKAGPLKAEVDKINKVATKAWTDLNAKLKKIPAAKHTDKIAALEAAMPKLRFSKQEKAAVKLLKREKDAVLQGRYTQVNGRALKLKGQAKIDYVTKELDAFKGSGHHDKLAKMVETERTALKTKAYNALTPKVKKAKTPADKIKLLEASKAEFAGTKYEKTIATDISNQLNIIKGKDFASLMARYKKLKTSESKIAELQRSKANFKGSKYERNIDKMLSGEKTRLVAGKFKTLITKWKKEKDPKKKIAILEAEAAQFKGTKYERKVNTYIDKGKKGLEGAMFKKVSGDAKKLKGQKKLDYLTSKAGEFKSKAYQGKIKSMIDAAKKTLKADEQKAKDAAAAKVYGKAMADLKKAKDTEAKKKVLTDALQKVAGTRYVDMLRKQLKALEKKKPAPKKAAPKKR